MIAGFLPDPKRTLETLAAAPQIFAGLVEVKILLFDFERSVRSWHRFCLAWDRERYF